MRTTVAPNGPSLAQWRTELGGPLSEALDVDVPGDRITLLCGPKPVADDTTKLLVSDPRGRPAGVVLCSAPVAPDLVARNMERARQAGGVLGRDLSRHIIEPLREGRAFGLSYALLPYCRPLIRSQWLGRVQWATLGPSIFAWLRRSTAATVSPGGCAEPETVAALQNLAAFPGMPGPVCAAASRALDRLSAGIWSTRRVLMHGDFWWGNLLIHPRGAGEAGRGKWRDRFAIIDWAGSRMDGYPIFDLVTFAQSVRLSGRRLTAEVAAHCETLGCDRSDAVSYLAAALGHIGLNLEHFPPDRFIAMAESRLKYLERLRG